MTEYIVDKLSNPAYANTNCVYVKSKNNNYLKIINSEYAIFKIAEDPSIQSNNIICMNSYQRIYLKCEIGSKIVVEHIVEPFDSLNKVTFVVKNLAVKKYPYIQITDEFVEQIIKQFQGIPIINTLQYVYDNKLNMSVCDTNNNIQIIGADTEIKFISVDKSIDIQATTVEPDLFKSNFNFMEMGIGGLNKEFEFVFRRAFSSRLIPDKILKNLGINHVRGMMLYGLPGCGKTLIARQIGKILNCEEPKIVSGPSLISSYQGKSEENIRNLFADAFADKNSKKLHLIILDEFDAISRKRGSINDNGLSDKLVNQFLSMIDGPESLNNILLIAMTNRLELIDDALLRPGRFEVQIEVGLPDEKGRLDILKIHTKKMNNAGYLQNVNLSDIAALTVNYTGAELESVIKNAVSYCIAKNMDPNNLSSIKSIQPIITQVELLKSVNEIKPQFGSMSSEIELITANTFELYSDNYSHIYTSVLDKINKLAYGKLLSILISGDYYVGKTMLACQIAKHSRMNSIKFINSETLINSGFNENRIYDTFEQGYKSESFILVLDSIEKIIEYSKLGNAYNGKILQTIYALLNKIVALNKKVVLILTSSNESLMDMLDLNTQCAYCYNLSDEAYETTQNKLVSTYFKENNFTY
jgi:vesicle-fusing ATPase